MEVGQSDEAILARERDGLIAALCLGDAEGSMILRIEDRDGAMVVEDQPTGLREDCISEVILRTYRSRLP
jgi:hypothetical protein